MTSLSTRCGLGYSPFVLDESLWPGQGVHRMEAGPSLLANPIQLEKVTSRVDHLSLHLARAPFSATADIQDAFVKHLVGQVNDSVGSVGLHLCGPLSDDLGRFGLGTGFIVNPTSQARSLRLLERLQDELNVPVLIENADFYHGTLTDAAQSIEWSNELAQRTGASLILDLAHLHIAAHNLGIPGAYFLGQVDLSRVQVLHVSGTTLAPDGVMHDGHSRAVTEDVWSLAELVLRTSHEPIDLVLEHTDPAWRSAPDLFSQDWERLRTIVSTHAGQAAARAHYDYSKIGAGYFANIILPQRYPELAEALGPRGFREVVCDWAQEFYAAQAPKSAEGGIAFLREGDRFVDPSRAVMVLEDFQRFLREAAA